MQIALSEGSCGGQMTFGHRQGRCPCAASRLPRFPSGKLNMITRGFDEWRLPELLIGERHFCFKSRAPVETIPAVFRGLRR